MDTKNKQNASPNRKSAKKVAQRKALVPNMQSKLPSPTTLPTDPVTKEPRAYGPYIIGPDGIKFNGTNDVLTLTNFTATIDEQLILHDGTDTDTILYITGLVGGEQLPRVEVDTKEFRNLDWVARVWGMTPMIFPHPNAERHIAAAIQASSTPTTTHVYTSTGWSTIDDTLAYVTTSGAITSKGLDKTVTVRLPKELTRYSLPAPTGSKDAFLASLSLAALAPPDIALPLWLATYRAALRPTDYAVHLAGRTGTFKSELTSLFQSHYGPTMDARHLPASWTSTAGALTALAYRAADAVMVVDDFIPTGTSYHVRTLQKTADDLIRAAGNQTGRSRLTDKSNLQTTMFPRGVLLSTGEDVPEQQSIRARMLIVELAPGDIKPDRLTTAQTMRPEYSRAMSDWIHYIAKNRDQLNATHVTLSQKYRDQMLHVGHSRTPPIIGDMLATAELIAIYAEHREFLTPDEAQVFRANAITTIVAAGDNQQQYLAATDPVDTLFSTIRQLMQSFAAHAKTRRGGVPEDAEAAGWTVTKQGGSVPDYKANGPRIGWIDADNGEFLFDPATLPLVKRYGGVALAMSTPTLLKRLKESGKMTRTDPTRQRHTVRMVIEGHPKQVLALQLEQIIEQTAPPINRPDDVASTSCDEEEHDEFGF